MYYSSHVNKKVESHSILFSSNIVYLQTDLFTGYNGIMIEQ